ncbi:unnamed protein product [Lymnaea stagnalis]|uniref:Uncharacterized protein n=1 Tax=Lymnaea stagnalis TaxID=6523 RepID=A0AAV2IE37_LYMST
MDGDEKLLMGCCGSEMATINLSLLAMPKKFDVDLSSFWFWGAALIIFSDPFCKALFGVHEFKYSSLCHYFGNKLAFAVYAGTSFAYSFCAFLLLHRVLREQGHNLELARNDVLLVGYIFLLSGITIKVHSYGKYGILGIMGGQYFQIPFKVKGQFLYDPYYHPSGTSTLMAYFGYSLIHASFAGLVLTVICGLSYLSAFHFERFHHHLLNQGSKTLFIKNSFNTLYLQIKNKNFFQTFIRKLTEIKKNQRQNK